MQRLPILSKLHLCRGSIFDNGGNKTNRITGTVCKNGQGSMWHPLGRRRLERYFYSLQMAPRLQFSRIPRTCPFKSRIQISFPYLNTALHQVSTQHPWTSLCKNKKQITTEQCKGKLQALTNTREEGGERGKFISLFLFLSLSIPSPVLHVFEHVQKEALWSHGV